MKRVKSKDRIVRTAARENTIRRNLGSVFEAVRKEKGLSLRGMAKAMESSVSQVQRVLHKELGGSLTLRTVLRAADVLELDVDVLLRLRSLGEE
jgi:transcriptional regulator with XRE-family HTH domain